MKGQRFIPLLVVAAGLLAYHNSFTGPFIFDDVVSIQENSTIHTLWPIWQPLTPPHRGGLTVECRPLINLSLAINYALGGYKVWGYHAFNLVVHILAGLTLLGVVRRTLLRLVGTRCSASDRPRRNAALPDNSAEFVALATAILWTVHPLQTESVTYIVQRAESIMGLFYLLTLYCFIRGIDSTVGTRCSASVAAQDVSPRWGQRPLTGQRGPTGLSDVGRDAVPRVQSSAALPSALWFTLSVVACTLGMASKEVMASAPLILLLYDRTFMSGSFRDAWQRRRNLYFALACTWLLLGCLVRTEGSLINALNNAKSSGIDRWGYLLTEPGVILHYLRLSVWPDPLCLDYYGWPLAKTWTTILPPALAMVILLGATAWACKLNSPLGFLGAWFFMILAPTSSFVPLDSPAFEHRMYLSLAGVIVLAVLGIHAIAGRRSVAVVAMLAVGLGFLTWRRNQDYRSELAIWQDTAIKRPNNPRAQSSLGVALARLNRPQEAIAHFEQALRLKPDFADAHNNLGVALEKAGRVPEAIAHCEQALRIKPEFAEAHYSLGVALEQAGRVQEAAEHYVRAVQIKPEYADAHNNLGSVMWRAGRVQEAIGQYQQALRIKPDYAEAHNNLGNALFRARPSNAVSHWEQALRINPNYAEAHNNWGLALEQTGQLPEAIAHYEQAVRINPNYAKAHFNLGIALEKAGRAQEAITQYEQALRIQPSMAAARDRLDQLQGLW